MNELIQIHLRCNDDYEPRFVVEIKGPTYKTWTQLEEIHNQLTQFLQHKEEVYTRIAAFRQKEKGGAR